MSGVDEETQLREVAEHPLRAKFQAKLRGLPAPIRRMLVIITAALLIGIGLSLIWLPGPFTLPFVIAGIAVLSTEFVWASTLLMHGKRFSAELLRLMRDPWILLAIALLVAVAAVSAYTVFRPGWWT